jgi:hypothetical protein
VQDGFKTKLSSVMFGNDKEDAMKKIEATKPPSVDLESYASSFLFGNPSEISNQISSFPDAGIQYLIVNFRERYNPNDQDMFSKDVMSRF